MKSKFVKRMTTIGAATIISIGLLAGCGQEETSDPGNTPADTNVSSDTDTTGQSGDGETQAVQAGADVSELEVRFGDTVMRS